MEKGQKYLNKTSLRASSLGGPTVALECFKGLGRYLKMFAVFSSFKIANTSFKAGEIEERAKRE